MSSVSSAARPWLLRLYERTPLPPLAIGLAIALAYLLTVALLSLATGHYYELPLSEVFSASNRRNLWFELLNAVFFALGPTLLALSLRGTRRDLHDLAPLLVSEEATVERVTRLPQTPLRVAGVVAAASGFAFAYWDPGLWETRPRPTSSDPFLFWVLARHGAMGWMWARAMLADVTTARAFGAVAGTIREVDLLDVRPLTPFARRGVRSVLFWMLGASLFSLFWAGPNTGRTNVVTFALFVGVAAAALLFPLFGIRRRIRAAKDEALARIRGEIRADQRALLDGGPAAAPAAGRLPALFAAEARTTATPEWPFDASTLLRFVLYAALGLGSWVGGAVVERLLGGWLG